MKKLNAYEPILSQIMLKIARETSFSAKPSLAHILEENPRLVVAFNHSTPLSWLPAISLLTAHVCARGGGQRVPMGIMDRFFFSVPGLNIIAAQITQSDHPLKFDELVDRFKKTESTDVVLFPEGSNCFFGEPVELQPFRSPKFVELAIRAGCPILLCAHRGSENWAKALPVPSPLLEKLSLLPPVAQNFLNDRLRKTGLFTLPMLPKAIDKFEMRCELYEPTLKEEDLSNDKEERDQQIRDEAALVHAKLNEMLAAIDTAKALDRSRVLADQSNS